MARFANSAASTVFLLSLATDRLLRPCFRMWPARYPTALGPNPARAWETPTQSTRGTLFRLRAGCSASVWTAQTDLACSRWMPCRSRRL